MTDRCPDDEHPAACLTVTCTACETQLPARQIERLVRQWTDTLNAQSGCPDCGVHAACGEIVRERDLLRSIVAKFKALEAKQTAVERMVDASSLVPLGVPDNLPEFSPAEAALFDAVTAEGT